MGKRLPNSNKGCRCLTMKARRQWKVLRLLDRELWCQLERRVEEKNVKKLNNIVILKLYKGYTIYRHLPIIS